MTRAAAVPVALPDIIAVTDRHICAPRRVQDVVAIAIAKGARGVWLREKDLPVGERLALATDLARLLAPVGGLLLVSCDGSRVLVPPELPPGIAVGVHLSARAPTSAADSLRAVAPVSVVGRSCHTRADLGRAEAEGCDYVTVSPVFASRSKPGYGPPLGLAGLRELCGATSLPVVALGGVDHENASDCRGAGAAAVAMLGAFMRTDTTEHPTGSRR